MERQRELIKTLQEKVDNPPAKEELEKAIEGKYQEAVARLEKEVRSLREELGKKGRAARIKKKKKKKKKRKASPQPTTSSTCRPAKRKKAASGDVQREPDPNRQCPVRPQPEIRAPQSKCADTKSAWYTKKGAHSPHSSTMQPRTDKCAMGWKAQREGD